MTDTCPYQEECEDKKYMGRFQLEDGSIKSCFEVPFIFENCSNKLPYKIKHLKESGSPLKKFKVKSILCVPVSLVKTVEAYCEEEALSEAMDLHWGMVEMKMEFRASILDYNTCPIHKRTRLYEDGYCKTCSKTSMQRLNTETMNWEIKDEFKHLIKTES